jgi:AraC-like DNA-binding protein
VGARFHAWRQWVVTHLAKVPSALGLASRLAHERAGARGIAVGALLRRAGLTARELQDPDSRIPVKRQIEFLNLVAEALDEQLLGAQLARDFDLRRAGLIYYVLASSPTVREVFERGARYTRVVNEGVRQEFVDGRRVGLQVRYLDVSRISDRHQVEFWVVALTRICRHLAGRRLRPVRVRFTHFRAAGGAWLARYLGCPVDFGAAGDEILFARDVLQLPVGQADPWLNRLLVRACEQALGDRCASNSFALRVENAMAPLLPHGEARIRAVAARLGMSSRTLARRLANEGLTFSALLTRMREQLALRYLRDDGLPVSKVAWLLGYQEVGAFSHAFRRWTGKSPRQIARRS